MRARHAVLWLLALASHLLCCKIEASIESRDGSNNKTVGKHRGNHSFPWEWQWAPIGSEQCSNCSLSDTSICSTEVGGFSNSPHLPSFVNQTSACVQFQPGRAVISRREIIDFLGPNAVLAFVGDSNMRSLFLAAMEFFGRGDWYGNLEARSSTWTNATTRRRYLIDHTYLCPKAFGPTNLTLAFLWKPFIHRSTFFSSRVWSRCGGIEGQCTSSLGIPFCDGSYEAGVHERWECGESIDEIQFPELFGKRKFVVVSHGGIHDTLHTYNVKTTPDDRLQDIHKSISQFYQSLKSGFRWHLPNEMYNVTINGTQVWRNHTRDSYCWSAYGSSGAEIMISPLHFGKSKYTRKQEVENRLNHVLHMFVREFHRQGLDEEFDGYIDAFQLTHDENRSPFAKEDGIHYSSVVYRALLDLVLEKVMSAEFRG